MAPRAESRILDEGQSFWLSLDGQPPAENPDPGLVRTRDYTDADMVELHLQRQAERRALAEKGRRQ